MTPPRIVTALRELPDGRVSVELDGAPWRPLPAEVVVRARLGVGAPLDREAARLVARELRRSKALVRATRALSGRDRSRRSLDGRLARAGVTAGARADAIAALERAGLVDDRRIARTRAQALAERGYGDTAIRLALEREEVEPEAAAEALSALEPERERARRIAERDGTDPRSLRRLVARGFDPDTVADVAGFAPGA